MRVKVSKNHSKKSAELFGLDFLFDSNFVPDTPPEKLFRIKSYAYLDKFQVRCIFVPPEENMFVEGFKRDK